MAETNGGTPTEGAQTQPTLPAMKILGQFIRDMSFENIAAQKSVSAQVQPEMQVQVGVNAGKRAAENQYDVMIKLKIESKTKAEPPESIFLLEIDYAGIFQIENIAEAQLHPFLMIECPRMLFPYLRRIVSDITRDGGYPPINLDQIDFIQLYRQRIAATQAAQQTKMDA